MGPDKATPDLSITFMKMAEEHSAAEENVDTPLNLAALCVLLVSSGLHGAEDLMRRLVFMVRDKGRRMNLFDIHRYHGQITQYPRSLQDNIGDWSYAAWGAYGVLT